MPSICCASLIVFALTVGFCRAEVALLTNAEFNKGDVAPDGWSLSGGQGAWVERELLEVTGGGSDSNFWRTDCEFEPGKLYRFEMRVRHLGSGSVIAGPAFANRDYHVSAEWKWIGHVFRVPDNVRASYVRLGQWHATGKIQFDSVRLVPVVPLHQEFGGSELGEGESVLAGRYTFSGRFAHEGSNYHRVLERTTTAFNSNRWTFGSGNEVVYRIRRPDATIRSGTVSVNVNYHLRGTCITEVGRDGNRWETLFTQNEVSTASAPLPAGAESSADLWLRIRGNEGCSFQVDGVELTAETTSTLEGTGGVEYAEVTQASDDFAVDRLVLRKGNVAELGGLVVSARHSGAEKLKMTLAGSMTRPDGTSVDLPPQVHGSGGGRSAEFTMLLPPACAGRNRVCLELSAPSRAPLGIEFHLNVPDFYRADYGARIDGLAEDVTVWWCDATRKVPRNRPVPQLTAKAAELSAARNDHEAVQIVLCPQRELLGLTAVAGPLAGPGGASIAPEDIQVLRVAYHYVHTPTDATGIRDFWPDALPPAAEPLDLPAGKNQPLWILIHVPDDAVAGDYEGQLSLKAAGFKGQVPLRLHVWDFTLPKQNHLETAFGLSAGNIFRYHQAKTQADKRRVWEMYLQCFADHRISPYDPTPLDPIDVEFLPNEDPPRAEVDFTDFDAAMERAVKKFNVTNFRLPIQGMGGGTFHARYEPRIAGLGEDTPQYQALFSSYVRQIERHLKDHGWLKMAYIYWFDEPAPRDYECVRNGRERLKKYAPGLTTMLTEQPESELVGPVDIWCPVSPNYDHANAEPVRAKGARFWWYVCTGPKAPYCTLFIDHPATEMRVWLWQTWQRDISGLLVWSSNYWTSSAAFPDPAQPQNPYDDPMGYVSGYSTPKGTKRHWGNGDGRFVYPPVAAAVPGASGSEPVFQPPVSSIRWEMLREGIEDFEFLYMLRDRLSKNGGRISPAERARYEALLAVPEQITQNMTTFTKDPSPIYARRAAVAEAIERLAD